MTLAIEPSSISDARPSLTKWSWRDVFSLLLALVVTQASFWLFVTAIVNLSPLNLKTLERFRVISLDVAPVKDKLDFTPVAEFKVVSPNQLFVPNPGLLRFSIHVKNRQEGIGIFIPRLADNAVLLVNGQQLNPPAGDWDPVPSRTGVVGMFFEVPATTLKDGSNEFALVLVRSCCRAFVAGVYAGPLGTMRPIYATARWLRINLTWIIISTSLLIGLVAASLLPLGRGRAFLWSVIGCSLTVSIGIYFYIDAGHLVSSIWRAWYGHIIGAVVGYLAFLSLVNAWTNGPSWIYRLAFMVGLVATSVTAAAVPFQTLDQVLFASRIVLVVVMTAAILGVYWLLWRYVQTKDVGRYWQAGLLMISPTAALIDYVYALDLRVQPIYFVPFSNLTLMAAIGIALAQQGAKLYTEAEAANQTLEARIAAKEQELSQAAQALLDQEAQTATQTERARIMRDMHDGMGGQLLSLLIQTRDPETPRAELEQAVETAIGDLRLLIDSLDSVGDSLDIALATFRDRLSPRLRAAGIELEWHNGLLSPTSGQTPSIILNVYRILQEAITNALRHAGATKLTISINAAQQADRIEVTVADNGRGFGETAIMGRGLANMRRRAVEIGGHVGIDSNTNGTMIQLSLPA